MRLPKIRVVPPSRCWWVAEAYTAFYDPTTNSPARAKLNAATRGWFGTNLGPPRTAEDTGDTFSPEAALKGADGNLTEIPAADDTELEAVVTDAVVEIADHL